jgi:hypothetical protein
MIAVLDIACSTTNANDDSWKIMAAQVVFGLFDALNLWTIQRTTIPEHSSM